MNKGSLIHPRLMEQLTGAGKLFDREVTLQDFTEVANEAGEMERAYADLPGLNGLPCRRARPSNMQSSTETREDTITVSEDTEVIVIARYLPQVRKNMRAILDNGRAWDIKGVVWDSARTQTELIVELVES